MVGRRPERDRRSFLSTMRRAGRPDRHVFMIDGRVMDENRVDEFTGP